MFGDKVERKGTSDIPSTSIDDTDSGNDSSPSLTIEIGFIDAIVIILVLAVICTCCCLLCFACNKKHMLNVLSKFLQNVIQSRSIQNETNKRNEIEGDGGVEQEGKRENEIGNGIRNENIDHGGEGFDEGIDEGIVEVKLNTITNPNSTATDAYDYSTSSNKHHARNS